MVKSIWRIHAEPTAAWLLSLLYMEQLYPNKAGLFNWTWGAETQTGRESCWKAIALIWMKFPFFLPPPALSFLFLWHALSFLLPLSVYLQQTSEVIASRLLFLSQHFWEGGPCELYTLSQASPLTSHATLVASRKLTSSFIQWVYFSFIPLCMMKHLNWLVISK